MLALLQLAKEHLRADGSVDRDAFKAIYVAPMKALAQEVVSKFQERLKPLGMVVKEYTGISPIDVYYCCLITYNAACFYFMTCR